MPILKLSVVNWGYLLKPDFNSRGKKLSTQIRKQIFLSLTEYNPAQFHCKITHFSRDTRLQKTSTPETLTSELIGKHKELSYRTNSNFNKYLH